MFFVACTQNVLFNGNEIDFKLSHFLTQIGIQTQTQIGIQTGNMQTHPLANICDNDMMPGTRQGWIKEIQNQLAL